MFFNLFGNGNENGLANYFSKPYNALSAVNDGTFNGLSSSLQNVALKALAPNQPLFKPYTSQVNNFLNPGNGNQGGLLGALGKFGNFMNSDAGKGVMGLAGLGMGIMDFMNSRQAHKANMANMKLAREQARYNLDRTKHENQRLDKRRAEMTDSFFNGKVY